MVGLCVNSSLTITLKPGTVLSTSDANVPLRFSPPSHPGAMRSMRSAWMWSMPGSRFDPRWPILPAPASSMLSAPTFGWRLSPSRMSTLPWCSSSSTRCAMSWRRTSARSARRTSRTTLCWSTSCWMVGDGRCNGKIMGMFVCWCHMQLL